MLLLCISACHGQQPTNFRAAFCYGLADQTATIARMFEDLQSHLRRDNPPKHLATVTCRQLWKVKGNTKRVR